MVVGAFLTFAGGFIQYLCVLGNEKRQQGLALMMWGVNILFVLVVLLGIINILQGPISFVIGIVVILFLCFAAVLALAKPRASSPTPEH
jgi:heme A synthase